MADVAIVGAGIGGLSAAVHCVAAGHQVTIYEAASEAGGKIGREQVGGVEFDTGPSVLTMPDVFQRLFDTLGEDFEAHVELTRHEHVFDYLWPDGMKLSVHFTPEQTVGSVRETLGADAAKEMSRFLTYAEGIWEAAAPAFVYGDAPTFGSALSLGLRSLGSIRRIDPMRTMIDGIRRHVSNPYLVDVLARYATYNGSDPWQAPATLNCIAHVELSLGCYGVRGGMYRLVEALTALLATRGVEFVFDAFVAEIAREGDRHRLATMDGHSKVYDAVIANADAAQVFGSLVPALAGHDAGPPSMSGWTGVLRAPRRERAGHSAYFPIDYRQEFRDIFEQRTAPREPTVYVCAQERAHARAGFDDDTELLFVMANAPAAHDGSIADGTSLRLSVERRLRELDWWDDSTAVLWERGPAGLAAQFPGSRGAIYGASSNSRFSAFQRPANRVADVAGLYLASGSAHPGGGVPLCALSGEAAARALSEDFPVR